MRVTYGQPAAIERRTMHVTQGLVALWDGLGWAQWETRPVNMVDRQPRGLRLMAMPGRGPSISVRIERLARSFSRRNYIQRPKDLQWLSGT